jgi:ribonuclease PH
MAQKEFSRKDLDELITLASGGIKTIINIQKKLLGGLGR